MYQYIFVVNKSVQHFIKTKLHISYLYMYEICNIFFIFTHVFFCDINIITYQSNSGGDKHENAGHRTQRRRNLDI